MDRAGLDPKVDALKLEEIHENEKVQQEAGRKEGREGGGSVLTASDSHLDEFFFIGGGG